MATLTITAEFEPNPSDPLSATHGPRGVLEALTGLGLYDVDVEVDA